MDGWVYLLGKMGVEDIGGFEEAGGEGCRACSLVG